MEAISPTASSRFLISVRAPARSAVAQESPVRGTLAATALGLRLLRWQETYKTAFTSA